MKLAKNIWQVRKARGWREGEIASSCGNNGKFGDRRKQELLRTVDFVGLELRSRGIPMNREGVKWLIASAPKWVPKLDRRLFCDDNSPAVIEESRAFLQDTYV